MRLLTLLTFYLLITACDGLVSPPTIDASSESAFEASTTQVKASLNPQQQTEFEAAVMQLAFSELDFSSMMSGDMNPEALPSKIREQLDGKTGQEVIAYAEQKRLDREREQRQQALQEINEIKAEIASAVAAEKQLLSFEVRRSRFYQRQKEYGGRQPVIELTVMNGIDTAVSRAYFEGVVATPGRSVPWIKEDFNYEIAGGLEPGEEATWNLAPNQFSDWGTTDVPSDAIMTVTVTRLDGPDGKPIGGFDADDLEDARNRLAALQEKYGAY